MLGKAQGTSCPDSRASTGSRPFPAFSPHGLRCGYNDTEDGRGGTAATVRGGARESVDTPASLETGSAHSHPSARSRRAELRKARREWIVRVGEAPPDLPVWTSRKGWLDGLAAWLASEDGLTACARVNIRPDRVLRAAVVLAAHADHATGRNCAVTNAKAGLAAKCSPRTLTTVRGVLGTSGFAVEVYRGTAAPGCGRRPSVWHLISRRAPVDNPAVDASVCALPPSRRDRRSSPDSSNSPSGRVRASRSKSQSTRKPDPPTKPCAPRPLHVQLLAAGIVFGSHGLERGHIGRICDALLRSQLDLNAWTAKQLLDALNNDMQARNSSWPDRIDNAAGFLASRLRHLPVRPQGTQKAAKNPPRILAQDKAKSEPAITSREAEHRRIVRWHTQVTEATTRQERTRLLHAHSVKFGRVVDPVAALAGAGRRAARLFPDLPLASGLGRWADQVLSDGSNSVAAAPNSPSIVQDDQQVDDAMGTSDCVLCGAAHAPTRPELPLKSMSTVCDRCWPVVAAELGGTGDVDVEVGMLA